MEHLCEYFYFNDFNFLLRLISFSEENKINKKWNISVLLYMYSYIEWQ